ncbi:MAG: hypothetical protein IKO52_06490 [Clostridia bacterium]|nr:hypothetical protein [Clostridia bacterium]
MIVKVAHLESGVTEVKNNVELVLEHEDRFELAGKRKKTRGKPVRAISGRFSGLRCWLPGRRRAAEKQKTARAAMRPYQQIMRRVSSTSSAPPTAMTGCRKMGIAMATIDGRHSMERVHTLEQLKKVVQPDLENELQRKFHPTIIPFQRAFWRW